MPTAGPYGDTGGSQDGPGNGGSTVVTKITAYASNSYIFGLKLYWGSTYGTEYMFGSTGGETGVNFDLLDDPVYEIRYFVDGVGNLRSIKFYTLEPRTFEVGLQNQATSVAFSDEDYTFTDLFTYSETISGKSTITGITFYYNTSSLRLSIPIRPRSPWPANERPWSCVARRARNCVARKRRPSNGRRLVIESDLPLMTENNISCRKLYAQL